MKNFSLSVTGLVLILFSLWSNPVWGKELTTTGQIQANVVLLITDDQGYGDLGVHGNPVIKTPNLDRLAGESIRLDDYHVAPTCAPTRAALITGRWQNRTGVWHTIMGRSMLRMSEVTLADMLAGAGYETAMVGKWHLGDNYPYRPHDRGFKQAYYHGGGGVGQTPDYWNNAYFDGSYFRNGVPEPAEGYVTDVFFDEAISFIDSVRGTGKPFFLYLSTNAPHGPMHAPQSYADLYKGLDLSVAEQHFFGMISNIDDNVGRLLRHLEKNALAENTIFIFTTDNGTSTGHKVFNAGMRGKKGSEYDGGHRVPFFLRWPAGGLAEARVVDRLTAHVDIVPTLLDLTGTPAPENVRFDGDSIRPLLEADDSKWPDRTLITDSQRVLDPIKWRRATVMTDRWRMINGEELYDMQADTAQERNVAEAHPAVFNDLKDYYQKWWAELRPTFAEPTPIVLGHEKANPATLTAHDWLGANAQTPWNQRHIRNLEREKDGIHKNYWWVDVAVPGTYRFELRRWPVESGLAITAQAEPGEQVPGTAAFRTVKGKPFTAVLARLEIDGQVLKAGVGESTGQVSFTAKLNTGKRKLAAVFTDAAGQELGAYYLTVTRLEEGVTLP